MNKDDFKFLVECAIKAPSGHNTQAWKFENTEKMPYSFRRNFENVILNK